MLRFFLIWLIVLAGGLTGCRQRGGTPPPSTVSGTVTYLERMALPDNAVITVQLLDVSKADAPATVLGEQVIPAEGKQPPYAFEIAYDPAQVQPSGRYSLSASIMVDGELWFRTTQSYPVITGGNPIRDIELVLQRI